jgi:putative DNA primase/helicase
MSRAGRSVQPGSYGDSHGEASAILDFCIEGFHLWHKQNWLSAQEPITVKSATDDYLRELDPLTPFLDECCDIGPWGTHKTQATDLFNAYKAFTKSYPEFGGEGDSMVVFSHRMQDAGSRSRIEKKKLHGKMFWCGIRLKTDDDRELVLENTGGGG